MGPVIAQRTPGQSNVAESHLAAALRVYFDGVSTTIAVVGGFEFFSNVHSSKGPFKSGAGFEVVGLGQRPPNLSPI